MTFFTAVQYKILRLAFPGEPTIMSGAAYEGKSKIRTLMGEDVLDQFKGKTVIDFGCGCGNEVVEIAGAGARMVIGLDIQPDSLEKARRAATSAGLSDRCSFASRTEVKADIVVSLDSFEHFNDPAAILRTMRELLVPGGLVLISFGPTWYHPLGGHLVSVFPWAHVVFSEAALMKWRSHIRSDGATRYSECAGGLNQMTIRRFEQLVRASGFSVEQLEPVPIRKLRWAHCKLTREWTTAIVRARLRA